MKIAILGYGKMGKAVERLALGKGHEIVLKTNNLSDPKDLSSADVAIEFSDPTAAFNNITLCFKHGVPVVSGTTGWLDAYDDLLKIRDAHKASFIYASNFSVGANLFFKLNKDLAKIMGSFSDYKVEIEEIHHLQKLDAPSGTAISLAEHIIENSDYKGWQLENASENEIPIKAKRIEGVIGTHKIKYKSSIDSIGISHEAHSREGFALGAILAAEWLQDKTGVFTMNDVLNIS